MSYFGDKFGEFRGVDRLHAVGEGLVGGVVDLDEEAVGSHGGGGAGERQDFVAFAGAVAWINEDGEVAAFFYGGDDGEVGGVPGMIGEGANAAVAEHYVLVAFAGEFFGGH